MLSTILLPLLGCLPLLVLERSDLHDAVTRVAAVGALAELGLCNRRLVRSARRLRHVARRCDRGEERSDRSGRRAAKRLADPLRRLVEDADRLAQRVRLGRGRRFARPRKGVGGGAFVHDEPSGCLERGSCNALACNGNGSGHRGANYKTSAFQWLPQKVHRGRSRCALTRYSDA